MVLHKVTTESVNAEIATQLHVNALTESLWAIDEYNQYFEIEGWHDFFRSPKEAVERIKKALSCTSDKYFKFVICDDRIYVRRG